MKWYNYVFCFVAGLFLAHVYPHVVHGLSVTNLFWATAALVTGIVFMKLGKLSAENVWTILLVIAGIAVVFMWGGLHHHFTRIKFVGLCPYSAAPKQRLLALHLQRFLF